MALSFYKNFLDSDFSSRMPIVTPLIIGGLAIAGFKYMTNQCTLIENNETLIVENQKESRPVLLFDYNTLLVKQSSFPFVFFNFSKSYSEEFIYTMAHYYELICLTDVPSFFASSDLAKLDPLGCISYKIFVNDKSTFDKKCLNRGLKQLVVLSGKKEEFHSDFNNNTLYISNKHDKLLDISHFLINLYYSKIPDYRETIMSYYGTPFSKTFKRIQEELYNQRNLFDLGRIFKNDSFEARLREVNESKINDYRSIKNKVFGSEKKERYWSIAKNALKTMLLK